MASSLLSRFVRPALLGPRPGGSNSRATRWASSQAVDTRVEATQTAASDETVEGKSTAYPFAAIEAKWQAYWEANQTFRTPDEVDTTKPKYYVLDMFPYPRCDGVGIGADPADTAMARGGAARCSPRAALACGASVARRRGRVPRSLAPACSRSCMTPLRLARWQPPRPAMQYRCHPELMPINTLQVSPVRPVPPAPHPPHPPPCPRLPRPRSGAGLHVGHPEGYTATDILARYKRMRGFNVLHPMGWDAFGLPAEQYAIQTGTHPADTTARNVARFRQQLKMLGFSYDWQREVSTTDPGYYK